MNNSSQPLPNNDNNAGSSSVEQTVTPGSRPSRRKRWIAVSLGVILLAAIGTTLLLLRPWESGTGGSASSAETKWTCPMHPQVVETSKGICPICFMDLVPVRDVGSDADAAQEIPEDGLTLIPRDRILADVKSVKIGFASFSSTIRVPAAVDYNEATHKVITARLAGRIDRLFVDQTGTTVRRGSPLMEIYSTALLTAQQEFLIARSAPPLELPGEESTLRNEGAMQRHNRTIAAARQRLEILGMSAAEIRSLERSGAATGRTIATATASGIVTRRAVAEGAYVNEGTLLLELVDLSSVWVVASVPESDIWRVRSGMEMSVTGEGIGAEALQGRVSYIYPSVDAASRSVKVRASFVNSRGLLKPGMYLTATLLLPRSDALAVPVGAVIRTGGEDIVYVEVERNTFEARRVKLGERRDGLQEVVGGELKSGEYVVAEGGFLLDSERELR